MSEDKNKIKQLVTEKALDIMIQQIEDPKTPDDFAIIIKEDIENQNIPLDIWKQSIQELEYEGILVKTSK